VKVFFSGQSLLENSSIANSMRSGMEVDGISVFGNFPGTKISAFCHAVAYCRRMLLLAALEKTGSNLGDEADWERQIDVLLRTDKASREKIKAHMKIIDSDALTLFFSAAFEGMLWNQGAGLHDCGKTFVELGSLAPARALATLAGRASELLPAVSSNNSATRTAAARAMGMLGSHLSHSKERLNSLILSSLDTINSWESAVGAEANKVHGSVIALGYLLSRCVFYGRIEDIDKDLVVAVLLQVLEIVNKAADATNKEAAFLAIGLLSTAGLLTKAFIENSPFEVADITKVLATEAKKGNEKAIAALGRFAMVFDEDVEQEDDSALALILKDLYALHELREAEVHFTVGEALSCAAVGWRSDALLLSLDVDTTYASEIKRVSTLKNMMDKLLTDCKNTKPSLKKASGIWLFCLIQFCGHLDEVQGRLRECQAAFMGLLSARDDLVQETASRGLSLVYEQGDKDLKDRLVADLVASFTGNTTKLKVDEETELFEPGALPTGDGQSVTSYKDIMSLAAEVGDQSLVYKFMSLASNAATWSTRAAFGRFGLSSILSESAVDPKLYPKLYRYRFDPNPNVQRSMNEIWNALVKSPNVVIDEYFDDIMKDLLKNILGKEWRTRQASCAAIADLVQGRQFEKYEKYLSDIWDVAFKVLDDIKGSVRKAAETLCQVLTGILVRQLEAGSSSKSSQTMLKEVMPFLFSTRGLESPSKEVQAFAYDTVLKLVKSGGKTLLPFIPSLIEQILGLLSTLEPDFINYLHMNAAKYDTTQEKIDEARSTMISHSPMMEAIERCLDLLDEPTMKTLVPCLESVIKTAVGMPSKVGCAGVLVSLATRHSFIFRPHADIFLKDIEKAVLDRNSTVSAAYARAAGYIARLASDKQILRIANYSKDLYFSAEDETRRQISADIVYAISKFATDRFNALAADILPFVFLAKHDSDEHVKDQFSKTWDENVGGSRAVLLYLKEIITVSAERLESPKWTVKHTAALTIAEVVGSSSTEISLANAGIIWPALEKALSLKTFDGKEKVLSGFVKFVKLGKSLWSQDAGIAAQMTKIAIREAKRNNETYRPHAILALGEYAEARTDIDLFDQVYDVVNSRLEEIVDDDKMDTDNADDKATSSRDTITLTNGISALFRSVNTQPTIEKPLAPLPKLLKTLKVVLASHTSSINTRIAFYERAKILFTALTKRTNPPGSSNYELAYEYFALLELKGGAGSELTRTKRAEAAEAIATAFVVGAFGLWSEGRDAVKERLREELRETIMHERANGVKNVLERTMKVLDK
jgi:proteasome component ECM29